MKPQAIVNTFSKSLLTVAALLAMGVMVAPPAAVAQKATTAQTATAGTITGTVLDSDGEPVIGGSVLNTNTKFATVTDYDGKFHLKAAPGDRVTVSYVGHKPYTFTVGQDKSYSITLEGDTQLLDEVVAIGYGTQRKGDVTSAVKSATPPSLSRVRSQVFP